MIVFAIALLAQAGTPPPPAQRAAIQKYFDADLFDGASARWKWPPRGEKDRLYCGWVNAKNRMGGYVGWTPFMVMYSDNGRISSGSIGRDVALEAICGSNGYDVISPPRE